MDKKKIIDQVIVSLARLLKDKSITATGVASPLPMISTLLAKKTKDITYLNCTGAVNPKLKEIPSSSVSISVLEDIERFITLPELWDYALKGKIDTMFFSATQIDKAGNLNMTCIGDYYDPKVKLPGPAGSISMRNFCKECIVTTFNHTRKTFVEKVDFITSSTDKPTVVITCLGILELGEKPKIISYHESSGIKKIIENTGFGLDSDKAVMTKKPTKQELKYLKEIDSKDRRYNFL